MTRAEAIELAAGRLLADGLHAENVAGGLLPDEDYARLMAKIALDALLEAGMTFGEEARHRGHPFRGVATETVGGGACDDCGWQRNDSIHTDPREGL